MFQALVMQVIACSVRNNTLKRLTLLGRALDTSTAVGQRKGRIVWGHEMKITRILAMAVIAGSLGIGALHAQIREQQPAEFPPASYNGKQYVDSKGCVFIRAGIDGNVSWIPRVTRARKTVCGFKPSLSGQVASAPAAEKSVQITVNNTVSPTSKAIKPAPRRVAKPRKASAPVVVRQTAPKPIPGVTRQPVIVAAVPAAPQVRTTTRRVKTQTACPGASALSQQYLLGDGRTVVRCGPQTAPVVATDGIPNAAPRVAAVLSDHRASASQYLTDPLATPQITQNTRIVPKHVAYNRISTRNVTVPQGYKRVWEDDRLNPYRAEQSLAGRTQMLLIWTQTVPRRLIDTRTGRDVTASVPLIYPYIDVITQSRELGKVTIVQRDGQITKRVTRNSEARKPVYSSRSAPKVEAAEPTAPVVRALAGKQYVQIGTFGKTANAQRSARKIARMGYPARIGKHRKSGKTYLTVQAGPFNDAGALQSAIKRLRDAGYADAFARN